MNRQHGLPASSAPACSLHHQLAGRLFEGLAARDEGREDLAMFAPVNRQIGGRTALGQLPDRVGGGRLDRFVETSTNARGSMFSPSRPV